MEGVGGSGWGSWLTGILHYFCVHLTRRRYNLLMLTLSPTVPSPVASGARPVLRYPGGKQRAVRILADYIPQGESELCSPFLGGGSFELHCATHLGMQVHAYDNFRPLVEFWNALLSQPAKLAAEAARFLPNIPRAEFYRLQKEQGKLPRQLERAGAFYVINRASFSGCTLSGGMSPGHPRFTVSAVERVRQFPGKMVARKMKVRKADFSESITAHPKALIYADPPYMLENQNLYGDRGDKHAGFDHGALSETLQAREGRWLLSYNDCPPIRDLYRGRAIFFPHWRYGMSRNKSSREILILSDELAEALNDSQRATG